MRIARICRRLAGQPPIQDYEECRSQESSEKLGMRNTYVLIEPDLPNVRREMLDQDVLEAFVDLQLALPPLSSARPPKVRFDVLQDGKAEVDQPVDNAGTLRQPLARTDEHVPNTAE